MREYAEYLVTSGLFFENYVLILAAFMLSFVALDLLVGGVIRRAVLGNLETHEELSSLFFSAMLKNTRFHDYQYFGTLHALFSSLLLFTFNSTSVLVVQFMLTLFFAILTVTVVQRIYSHIRYVGLFYSYKNKKLTIEEYIEDYEIQNERKEGDS